MKPARLLWLIPLALVLLIGGAIFVLPGLVASGAHRATIEALASSLTGRSVHINGKLSLALLPSPQLIAGNITITGPGRETITAKSLTLDIALNTLLHGRLTASSLTLQSPVIALPWPLPGGAAAVAPPPWLAALHAQIENGQISLGGVQFTHVDADVFTGADGAVTISGTSTLRGQPLTLTVSLGAVAATGAAPLTIDGQTTSASLHLSGSFSAASTVAGTVALNTGPITGFGPGFTQPIAATGNLSADSGAIALSGINAVQGGGTLTGSAALNIAAARLTLDLASSNIFLPTALPENPIPALPGLAVHLSLDAANPSLAGVPLAHLHLIADAAAGGLAITTADAALPGDGTVSASGAVSPAGNLQGKIAFASDHLASAFGGAASMLPAGWQRASLAAAFAGTGTHLTLSAITGGFGPAAVSGTLVLDRNNTALNIAGSLHFDQLDLAALATALQAVPPRAITGDFEITAGQASYRGVKLTRLLADAALNNGLVVRRLTASLYGGLTASSFLLGADGQIAAARALLSLPSAAPLAALAPAGFAGLGLPAGFALPAGLATAPLSALALAANGPPGLLTSAVINLGDIGVTASPTLDLAHGTAAGPLTLRYPNAIGLFKLLGQNAGLAWPGAGSVSLRADLAVSPAGIGLPDFVLTMGDLTASGTLTTTPEHGLNADIAADTLALPPFPADVSPLWKVLAQQTGKISISANQVLLAGASVFGPAAAQIQLQPGAATFNLRHAALGNGNLAGTLTAALPAGAAPALTAKFTLTKADLAAIDLPVNLPLTLPTGIADATASLTAAGFTPQAWAATLAGGVALSASNGSLTGFNLPGLAAALTSGGADALTNACLTGASPFDSVHLSGNFSHGIFAIASANLSSPAGAATASGTIDIPDQAIALKLNFTPKVTSPPGLGLAMIGNWAAPKKIPSIKSGLLWQQTN
jgi:uncharacterized protein involved in outer membrane biogenesis